jgi:hypothetical protein
MGFILIHQQRWKIAEIEAALRLVRFDRGIEYEIQGIYEWNRTNRRWLS